MNASERRAALRAGLEARQGLLLPGVFNALSARMVAALGFDAAYLSGAGLTNMGLGLPDLGFIGLRDVEDEVGRIRDAVDLPLLVDADTGFGNAVNVWRTIKVLERAGADAIQIEDQVQPKRCGHFAGKQVVELAEMVDKVKAAVDARSGSDLLVVARTDARALQGFEAAIERANALAEAGADVLFVEALESLEEVRVAPALLLRPAMLNVVVGGRTPAISVEEASRLRYGCVLYANAALQGALRGMREALLHLQAKGRIDEDPALVMSFAQRQDLVGKAAFDQLEERFAQPS